MAGRKFAVFDIDGTLIRWQLYHALADTLAAEGLIEPGAYQSMKDSRMAWKRRKEGTFRDYELKVISVYETILQKLTYEQFEVAASSVFEEYKDQVYTFTRDLIADLKKEKYLLFAISGSQTEIVAQIADYYGFDDYVGTVYTRSGGGFSGQKVIGSHDKGKTLKTLVKRHGAIFDASMAVGDSRSDIKMLELVEIPITLNPESDLFTYARKKGWKIVLERKNMVYELEQHNGKYELVKTNAG
jgi:HAD superfamily phosphoserine phosphatase-like hydrolase